MPSEEEIRRYYKTVWEARRTGDVVLIKTLMYTGVRVSELVNIRISDVDLDRCQIRINQVTREVRCKRRLLSICYPMAIMLRLTSIRGEVNPSRERNQQSFASISVRSHIDSLEHK